MLLGMLPTLLRLLRMREAQASLRHTKEQLAQQQLIAVKLEEKNEEIRRQVEARHATGKISAVAIQNSSIPLQNLSDNQKESFKLFSDFST